MGLEVRQHERFQQREWRFERVGWALVGLFVVAGLLGFLGKGPFSWATARSESGWVAVEYQRINHHEADDAITLQFAPEAVQNDTITVEFTGSWISGVDRQGISPQPSDELLTPGGVALEFPVDRAGTPETGRALNVTITFRAQEYGALSGEVSVAAERASFSQFVLP